MGQSQTQVLRGDKLMVEVSRYFYGRVDVDVARSQPGEKESEILLHPTWTNQVLNGLASHVSPPGICQNHNTTLMCPTLQFLITTCFVFFTSPILLLPK